MTTATTKHLARAADLEQLRKDLCNRHVPDAKSVRVCIGTGCMARGSRQIYELFLQAVKNTNAKVEAVKHVGCHGLCECGPIVIIQPGNIFYQRVEEPDVPEIFRETVMGDRIVERLLYEHPASKKKVQTPEEIPFYQTQEKIVLEQTGKIDPTDIEDYIETGGYGTLAKALTTMAPDEIVDCIADSGLRGRGGGGFPTGRKWRSCRNAHGNLKYVICNGDEGDPGAFMDCAIMVGNPHLILEGMIIGAYAIGAAQGYVYVRNEYPLAVEHLRLAIESAREYGLLGEGILGSDFCFDLRINRGGGAFICGESTALMASLEGRPGEPRAKYVHTVESGLWGRPTNLNNAETWANVPPIIKKGADWFSAIGTEKSKGTKVFSLVGEVVNTGLVEVPMGITLRRIIEDIGGGLKDGKTFKAVQTGGPSGGCIPAEYLDTQVDFDELTRLGSMMGSGGMIVMDEGKCMVNIALYFTNFLMDESCGKCTPCREGLAQMRHVLERITKGEGEEGDIERLERLGEILENSSLCALGKTAANPVLSTLRYFRSEYESHINDKHCPAKQCRGLFRYGIDPNLCKGCGLCIKHCPVNAITGEKKTPHIIDQEKCTQCGNCLEKCPFSAVLKI